MTIEFQCEEHSEKAHCAMAQLSSTYKPGLIRQVFADMYDATVTLRQLTSDSKPRQFSLTAAEADAFVEAWTAFKENTATWLQIEQERKDYAELLEQERQLAVWKQVEQLTASIPGMEIIAREDKNYDYDKDDYVPCQAWEVRHRTLGHGDMYLYTVDAVLIEAQEIIEYYNQRLADCEEGEKENWKGWHSIAETNAQKFLATHRAHQAHKTAPLIEQQA